MSATSTDRHPDASIQRKKIGQLKKRGFSIVTIVSEGIALMQNGNQFCSVDPFGKVAWRDLH